MRAGDLEVRGVGSFKDEMKEYPDVMWVLGTRHVLSRNSVCSLDNCAIPSPILQGLNLKFNNPVQFWNISLTER